MWPILRSDLTALNSPPGDITSPSPGFFCTCRHNRVPGPKAKEPDLIPSPVAMAASRAASGVRVRVTGQGKVLDVRLFRHGFVVTASILPYSVV